MSDERGDPPNKDEVEHEAREHALELCRQFGWQNFAAGTLLAHITNGLNVLREAAKAGLGEEDRAEWDRIHHRTCVKVHELFVLYVPVASERQKIIEVAKRQYSAADMFLLDELEREQGLPPAPKLG